MILGGIFWGSLGWDFFGGRLAWDFWGSQVGFWGVLGEILGVPRGVFGVPGAPGVSGAVGGSWV